eukprot:Hpha_TRINITY_DN4653_c0_g1::TRINITY_DN4653_c0_g1_i1::g.97072::m.97072
MKRNIVFAVLLWAASSFFTLVEGKQKFKPRRGNAAQTKESARAGKPVGNSGVPHKVPLPGPPRDPIKTCPPNLVPDYHFDTSNQYSDSSKGLDSDGFAWDPDTPPRMREWMKKRYKEVMPGPPGSHKNDRMREYCSRAWLELEAFSADTEQNKKTPFAVACNDQSHANPEKRLTALCLTEPYAWSKHPRKWWRKPPKRRNGVRAKNDPPLVALATGANIMAGEASDSAALCMKTECRNTTFAAGSVLSRRSNPRELLQPLRVLGKGKKKARTVAFMTRSKHPAVEAAQGGHTKSDSNWHRFNFFEALKHAGVATESPRGLGQLPRDPEWNRTLGGGTVCEFVEATELYRPYLMVIAFENANLYNYVTEKIVNAFFAGSIPIFWGDETVTRYFNPKAYINAAHFPNLFALAEYVGRVMSDCDLQEQYLREPPCTRESLQNLLWWRGKDRLFESVLPQPPCG